MVLVAVPVFDILCPSTDQVLERRLGTLDGVLRATVNAVDDIVYAELDPARCSVDALVQFIQKQGYRTGTPRILPTAGQPAGARGRVGGAA